MKSFYTYSLSVDLSGPRGTLAIHQMDSNANMQCLESTVITQDGNHSENFLPKLNEALAQSGIALSQISRFITTAGPGSFTGLRVCMASLKALAYSQQKPIETMNGSEARALGWIQEQSAKENSPILAEQLIVLTYLTLDRFVSTHFKRDQQEGWRLSGEEVCADYQFLSSDKSQVILTDDRIAIEGIPVNDLTQVLRYPLEAKYLAETIAGAESRQTYTTLPEWINLVPNYFGSSRY